MSVKRFLEEAERFIKIKSVTYSGNEELASYIETWMESRGFEVKNQLVTHSFSDLSKRQFNVIGILGDPLVDQKIKTGLLLLNHLDTVDPGDSSHWKVTEKNPFQMTVKEDYVFGLGAVSGKLDFLCKMIAAQKFRNRKLKMPLYLVGVCGGEHSFFGSSYLLKSCALNPQWVLVGHPTQLKPCTQGRGFLFGQLQFRFPVIERGARGFNRKFKIRANVVTDHPSFPSPGQNSIDQLIDFLNLCHENGFDMKFSYLRGGVSIAQLPAHAEVEAFLTSHQLEDFKRFFKECSQSDKFKEQFELELCGLGESGIAFLPEKIFENLISIKETLLEINELGEGVTISGGHFFYEPGKMNWDLIASVKDENQFETILSRLKKAIQEVSEDHPQLILNLELIKKVPPFSLDGSQKLLSLVSESLKEVGLPTQDEEYSSYSQAGIFNQQDYETLIFGCGEIKGNLHCSNERVKLEALEKAIVFYEDLIQRVCV